MLPTTDQLLPVQRTMRLTLIVSPWFAPRKLPPTYRSLPIASNAATSPSTPLPLPVPKGSQMLPFQRATRLAVIGAPMAAIVIVLEMTDSYSWAALAAISVLVATQLSRALAARSSFDRQLEMRGVTVNDDHRPRSGWLR